MKINIFFRVIKNIYKQIYIYTFERYANEDGLRYLCFNHFVR